MVGVGGKLARDSPMSFFSRDSIIKCVAMAHPSLTQYAHCNTFATFAQHGANLNATE